MKISESGNRLHPLSILFSSLKVIKDFLFPIAIFVFTQIIGKGGGDSSKMMWKVLIPAAFVVFAIVSGILYWVRYRYRVVEGQLHIVHGVFVVKEQFIPLERIQTIDISESLTHRLFGLMKVQVQTAGGKKAEAVLTAVTRQAAEQLKQELQFQHPATESVSAMNIDAAADEVSSPYPVYRVSWSNLLVAGLTVGNFGFAITIIGTLLSKLDDIFPSLKVYKQIGQWFEHQSGYILLLILVVAAAWLFGVVISVVRFANFTVERREGRLFMKRGLFDRKEVTLPLRRIQAIRIVEEPLWQLFGLAAIHADSAGYGKEKGETSLIFPLMRKDQIPAFLQEMVTPFAVEDWQRLEPLPIKARYGYIFRPIFSIAVLTLAVSCFTRWGLLGLAGCLIAGILGFWAFRDGGSRTEGSLMLVRFRHIKRTTAIVPRRRIQSCSLTQSPFQRRKDLASFSMQIVSGSTLQLFTVRGVKREKGWTLMQWVRPEHIDR